MATTIPVGPGSHIRPYRKVRIENFPEGASQTFEVGDLLKLSSESDGENRVVIQTADNITNVVGVAAENATGTTGTSVCVWLADEDGEFLAHVEDAMTLDVNFVGDSVGAVADGTNDIWRVDTTETTSPVFKIVKLYDSHGDTNGRVVVKFLNTPRVFGS